MLPLKTTCSQLRPTTGTAQPSTQLQLARHPRPSSFDLQLATTLQLRNATSSNYNTTHQILHSTHDEDYCFLTTGNDHLTTTHNCHLLLDTGQLLQHYQLHAAGDTNSRATQRTQLKTSVLRAPPAHYNAKSYNPFWGSGGSSY